MSARTTSEDRNQPPAIDVDCASAIRLLLPFAEVMCMVAVSWMYRPIERLAPRSGAWIDDWNGRLYETYQRLAIRCDRPKPVKESHGQG